MEADFGNKTMKLSASLSTILLAATALLTVMATGAHAQNGLFLGNTQKTSTNSASSSNGLFWASVSGTPVLITNDFNAAFYMSALYSWRLSCGAANGPTLIKAGTYQTPDRAGDYSATTLDPSDNWAFWTVQE